MIGRLLSLCVSACGLLAFLYVYFVVPLGERTLYEHTRRILATDAAQDLAREAEEAAARVERRLAAEATRPSTPPLPKAPHPGPSARPSGAHAESDR